MFCLISISFTRCQFYGSLTAVTVLEKIVKKPKNILALALALFLIPGVINSQETGLQKEDFSFVSVNYIAPYQKSTEWGERGPNTLRDRALDAMIANSEGGEALSAAFAHEDIAMPVIEGSRFPYERNATGENIVRHGVILKNPKATFTLLNTMLILTTAGKEDGRASYVDDKTLPSTIAGVWYGPDGEKGTGDDEVYKWRDSVHHPINELHHLCFGASFPDMVEVLGRVNENEENRNRTLTLRLTQDNGSGEIDFVSRMWIAGALSFASIDPIETASSSTRGFRVRAFSFDEPLENVRLVVTIPGLPPTIGSLTGSGFSSLVREGLNGYVFQLDGVVVPSGEAWEDTFFLSAGVNDDIQVAITSAQINATGAESNLVVSDTLVPTEPLLATWESIDAETSISISLSETGELFLSASVVPEGTPFVVQYTDDVNGGWKNLSDTGSRVEPITDLILNPANFPEGGAIFRIQAFR